MFPIPPEELARLQAHQEKLQAADGRMQLLSYAWVRFFGAVTCTCKMFAPTPAEYQHAMITCQLHGQFIITTEDLLK